MADKTMPTPVSNIWRRINILATIGYFLLACSWIVQNYVDRAWKSQLQSLDRKQSIISFNETSKNLWYSALLHQYEREQGDSVASSLLAADALNYIQYATNVISQSMIRIEDDEKVVTNILTNSEHDLRLAKDAFKQGRYKEVVQMVNMFSSYEAENGDSLVTVNRIRYDSIKKNSEFGNIIFTAMYGLGASLLTIGKWRHWLLK